LATGRVNTVPYLLICLADIHEKLLELETTHVGCNIGGVYINVLAYADDTVILAPSWRGLQQLLSAIQTQY